MDKNQKSTFAAISYSYISMIDDYLNVLKNPCTSSFEYFDEEVFSVLKNMQALFVNLPSILKEDRTMREEAATKLVNYRSILEEKYRSLSAYKRELMHLTSQFNLRSAVNGSSYEDFQISEEEAKNLDFGMLAEDCKKFVFSEKNAVKRQERAALLLPYIPMRMTKESFISYMEKSLDKIHIQDDPDHAHFLSDILLQLFDGKLYKHYGESFKDIRKGLEDLKEMTNPEEFFDEADLTNETLDFALDVLLHLYHMICTFSNLLIFDALTFESLTDMHMSFYDLYCTIKGILEGSEDGDLFLETLPERVDDLKESIKVDYDKACKSNDIDPLFTLMQTYISMSVSHVFGFDAGKHDPYSAPVESILRDFMADLKGMLASLNPVERKLRMQYFMSVMPFIMNDTTFKTYVEQGFSNVSDPKRNLFTMMYLSNILEENSYFEMVDETGHDGFIPYDFDDDYREDAPLFGAPTHDHSNCSCGHDHDHECCGGHNHDADHECCGGHSHDADHECCGGHSHDGDHKCSCGHDHDDHH